MKQIHFSDKFEIEVIGEFINFHNAKFKPQVVSRTHKQLEGIQVILNSKL